MKTLSHKAYKTGNLTLDSGTSIPSLTFGLFLTLALLAGCSSGEKTKFESAKTEAEETTEAKNTPFATPIVTNVRVNPDSVAVGKDLNADKSIRITADVKSFQSPVKNVKLRLNFASDVAEQSRFFQKPLEVEMKHLDGTTWQAELGQSEIKALALNGRELKYDGKVVAQNEEGQVGMNKDPIQIRIQAPPADQG